MQNEKLLSFIHSHVSTKLYDIPLNTKDILKNIKHAILDTFHLHCMEENTNMSKCVVLILSRLISVNHKLIMVL